MSALYTECAPPYFCWQMLLLLPCCNPFTRRLLCASLRLRASAYADIVEVLAEHVAQFEGRGLLFAHLLTLDLIFLQVIAKQIELVRDQLQEKCDALKH
jgi:hypothetical protein